MSRILTVAIAALSLLAVVVMFIASGEPVVSSLRGTSLETVLVALGWTNAIAFNLAVGYLVSALFWLLVVYIPDLSRRRLIRDNLSRRYQDFKESVLQILLYKASL